MPAMHVLLSRHTYFRNTHAQSRDVELTLVLKRLNPAFANVLLCIVHAKHAILEIFGFK